jgi:hypothetical protein
MVTGRSPERVTAIPKEFDMPLPVGSNWFQKAAEPHMTKCISPNEGIFFISQSGKFDNLAVPAK